MRTLTLIYYDSEIDKQLKRSDIISDKLNSEYITKTLLKLVSDIEIKKFKEESQLEKIWCENETR
jgi:hypothetical protein